MLLPEFGFCSRARCAAVRLLPILVIGSLAHAGTARVSTLYPPGGQRGTEVEVVLNGSNVKDARSILFDEPGIEALSVVGEGNKVKAKLKISPDAALGEHRLRLVTNSGVSDLRLFFVTPFPMVEEKVAKNESAGPQPVALNTTVFGSTVGDDQDKYVIEAHKGQRLTVEVVAAHLQAAIGNTLYDAACSIAKEDGTVLAAGDDTAFGRQDPVISIVAPEDGKYVVTIRDSTNLGEGTCHYLMHIGTFAQPLAVFPGGGPAGEEVKLALLGDATGPLEQMVKLPAERVDEYGVYANIDVPAPLPNPFRVSPFPNVLESEPNNDVEHATAGLPTLPFACNGVIEKKGDLDFFKFTAKKGEPLDLTVYARALRSPLDSVLSVYNDKGAKLASNDDEGQPDSHLRWTAPADGEYSLSVGDQLNRGGAIYIYRVEITRVEPKIVSYLPEIVQNQNQERRAIVVPKDNRYATLVHTKRTDWSGALKLVPTGLPDGVTVQGGEMDASVDTIPLVFEAKAEAALSDRLIDFDTQIPDAPKDAAPVKREVEHLVDVIENGNQKPFYTVAEHKLAAAVADPIPVKLSLLQPKVPLLQNGSMNLKIHAERQGDFKGPITLTLLYVPPGVGSPGTATLKDGETEGSLPISANDKAPLKTWKICVVGQADFGKGTTYFSTELVDLQIAPGMMLGQIQRTFVDQSDSTEVTVKLDPKEEFEGKAKLSLMGLPAGVTAEPREVGKEDKEVKFDVKAGGNAIVGQHRQLFCQFQLEKEGEVMTNTFGMGGVLRVDKAATVAKNTEAK